MWNALSCVCPFVSLKELRCQWMEDGQPGVSSSLDDVGVTPRSACAFESRQPPEGGSGGSVETVARSCDVHLAVDPVHGGDEGDGDESDDEADEEDDGRLEQAR